MPVGKTREDVAPAGIVRGARRHHTGGLCQGAALIDKIDGNDPDTRSVQNAGQQLADEAQSDDQRHFAERGAGLAERVHGDRADRPEGGMVERNLVGNRNHEITGHEIVFPMIGELGAGGRDALTNLEFCDVVANFDHIARQRVAERRELLQSAHDLLIGCAHTLLAD